MAAYEQHLPPTAVFRHSKVTVAVRPTRALYTAGSSVDGIVELTVAADKVWLGRMSLELHGQEGGWICYRIYDDIS